MKKIILAGCVLLMTGCTQWKKLTNAENKDNHVEQIAGIWQGSINGSNAHFNMGQADRMLWGYFSIDYTGTLFQQIKQGHIYNHDFSITFATGPKCGQNFYANGTVWNGQMVVTLSGCTDSTINQTLELKK